MYTCIDTWIYSRRYIKKIPRPWGPHYTRIHQRIIHYFNLFSFFSYVNVSEHGHLCICVFAQAWGQGQGPEVIFCHFLSFIHIYFFSNRRTSSYLIFFNFFIIMYIYIYSLQAAVCVCTCIVSLSYVHTCICICILCTCYHLLFMWLYVPFSLIYIIPTFYVTVYIFLTFMYT